MPTPEEIKKITHEYGVLMAKDIPESNCLKNEVISSTEYYIGQFMSWLSRDYCIVPKSKVREEYEIGELLQYSNNREDKDAGLFTQTILVRIFGKSLFDEEKK